MAQESLTLEEIFLKFHKPEFLKLDPLEWVHRYSNPLDQQVAAVLIALMSHGAVEQIRKFSQDLLNRLENEVGNLRHVLTTDPARLAQALKGFYYRFNKAEDFLNLIIALQKVTEKNGSLKDWVQNTAAGLSNLEISDLGVLGATLSQMQKEVIEKNHIPFLWSDPKNGSACKRLCMLFRWMVRKDALDFGHWSGPSLNASHLVIPLDVHLWRWAVESGWTKRSAPSWRAAREISGQFSLMDPLDPIKFDFAICRSGMTSVREKRNRN